MSDGPTQARFWLEWGELAYTLAGTVDATLNRNERITRVGSY
jgi:hypothetical protein